MHLSVKRGDNNKTYKVPIPRCYCNVYLANGDLDIRYCKFYDEVTPMWTALNLDDIYDQKPSSIPLTINGTIYTLNFTYDVFPPTDYNVYASTSDFPLSGLRNPPEDKVLNLDLGWEKMGGCTIYNVFDDKYYNFQGAVAFRPLTAFTTSSVFENQHYRCQGKPNTYTEPSSSFRLLNNDTWYNSISMNTQGYDYCTCSITVLNDVAQDLLKTKSTKDEGDDYPHYPDDDPEDIPDGDGDTTSDPVPPPPPPSGEGSEEYPTPTIQTGFITLYNPNITQLRSLASFMWSTDFVDVVLKLLQNPYDAIITLKCFMCSAVTGGSRNIILGNVDTGVSANIVTQQYHQIDCGSINITRFYGNFLDYSPYTSVRIFLPFIGYRELDVDEVMDSKLSVSYNVDFLSGACTALVSISKQIGSTSLDSVLYQFEGMIATDIPLTSNNATQVFTAINSAIASAAIAYGTKGTGAPLAGAVMNGALNTMSSKVVVEHGSSLGGASGMLGVKTPYIVISRVIQQNPTNYAKMQGIPSNTYKTLSSLKGYTKMQSIQIKSTIGSVDETEEIKQLLLDGVVI